MTFNSKVRKLEHPLSDVQAFIREKRGILELAQSRNLHIEYKVKNRDFVTIFYHSDMINQDKIKLFIEYMEKKMKSETQDPHYMKRLAESKRMNNAGQKKIQCKVCEKEVKDRFRLLQCNHCFCKECIVQNITEKSKTEEIVCPDVSCGQKIALFDILNLFNQNELEVLFNKIKSNFLMNNRHKYRYCVTANCENILEKVENDEKTMLFCTSCGENSCFLCNRSHPGEACMIQRRPAAVANEPKAKTRIKVVFSYLSGEKGPGRNPDLHVSRR